uniref:hypothetical protein n=1 Tax=Burkholderia anthina TaxID=179879 RepID=UPI00158D182A|nr:hypothetical protein [Burkholderia anthina]
MNINTYTEFKDIAVGQRFIDADGFEYEKVNEINGRHRDARYTMGFVDYMFEADDRLRVQA